MVFAPLRLIAQHHDRQGRMCKILKQVADDVPDGIEIGSVCKIIQYLERDLTLHIRDEERGLFPLLKVRSHAEENMVVILA